MPVKSKITAVTCVRADYNTMTILSVDIMREEKGRWRNRLKIPDELPVDYFVAELRNLADSIERNCL